MEVETGDGVIRHVDQAGLPEVLRAALDAGQVIRRVQPVRPAPPEAAAHPHPAAFADLTADSRPRRAGLVPRLLYGAAHRARLLT